MPRDVARTSALREIALGPLTDWKGRYPPVVPQYKEISHPKCECPVPSVRIGLSSPTIIIHRSSIEPTEHRRARRLNSDGFATMLLHISLGKHDLEHSQRVSRLSNGCVIVNRGAPFPVSITVTICNQPGLLVKRFFPLIHSVECRFLHPAEIQVAGLPSVGVRQPRLDNAVVPRHVCKRET